MACMAALDAERILSEQGDGGALRGNRVLLPGCLLTRDEDTVAPEHRCRSAGCSSGHGCRNGGKCSRRPGFSVRQLHSPHCMSGALSTATGPETNWGRQWQLFFRICAARSVQNMKDRPTPTTFLSSLRSMRSAAAIEESASSPANTCPISTMPKSATAIFGNCPKPAANLAPPPKSWLKPTSSKLALLND